jgi:hypothetical protein
LCSGRSRFVCLVFTSSSQEISSLENVEKVTNGRIKSCGHFDSKGKLTEYLKTLDIPFVVVMMSAFFENFTTFFPPQREPDGTYCVDIPMGDKNYNGIAVDDLGGAVLQIMDNFDKYKGQEIGLAAENMPVEKYCDIMSEVLGKQVRYKPVTVAEFSKRKFPGADDLAGMFLFYQEGPIDRRPEILKSIFPEAKTFRQWISQTQIRNKFMENMQ